MTSALFPYFAEINTPFIPAGRPGTHSAVPTGLMHRPMRIPNVETLGYSRMSLRDEGGIEPPRIGDAPAALYRRDTPIIAQLFNILDRQTPPLRDLCDAEALSPALKRWAIAGVSLRDRGRPERRGSLAQRRG